MNKKISIRLIRKTDAAAALAVYRPYVQNSVITFDYEVPSLEEFSEKIRTITAEYPWLVCEYEGKIAGYAYGSRHRSKAAYQWSPESTIYVAEEFHGTGIARLLYKTVFEILLLQRFVNVFAGVTLPNPASENFHRSLGFTEIGVFKNIGYKLGKWNDVRWFQLQLSEWKTEPGEPLLIGAVATTEAFEKLMQKANEELLALKIAE